jgi:hypothetical protein
MMTPALTVDARSAEHAPPLVLTDSDMAEGVLEEEVLHPLTHDVTDDVDNNGANTLHRGVDDDDVGTGRRRRQSVVATIALIWSLVLVLGVFSGYLNAESLDKCGECIQSLSTSSPSSSSSSLLSTSFLQNDTLSEDALRTVVY